MRPDFAEIRRRCDGMMSAEVYERVYDAALAAPGEVFVEVGTAHGAATVCLALALRDSGRGGRVYSFDRFGKGGRAAYANGRNLEIARESLAAFGVADMVGIVPGDIAKAEVPVSIDGAGLLMLDCDGRIDRDFAAFYDRLRPGATIIIDDCADRVRATRRKGRLRIDQKHRLTFLLTSSAAKHELICETGMANETWIGVKRDRRFADWPQASILNAYRRLVFAGAPPC
jgi:predicted O-methyltransferase YrrM